MFIVIIYTPKVDEARRLLYHYDYNKNVTAEFDHCILRISYASRMINDKTNAGRRIASIIN